MIKKKLQKFESIVAIKIINARVIRTVMGEMATHFVCPYSGASF